MDKIFIKVTDPNTQKWMLVNVNQIVACTSTGEYTEIILSTGTKLIDSRPITKYETLMQDFGIPFDLDDWPE